MAKLKRGWLLFTGCLFAATAIIAIMTVISSRPLEFDSHSWRKTPSLRPRMLSDLLTNHNLKGASRREVIALFGEPMGQDSIRDGNYIYWVGSRGIDDAWMELRFNQDAVVDVRVYPD
jgi:hypothetical protein